MKVLYEFMSEFKFSCPVCGQHIAADASDSGKQIECPTCFQKIIVPEAPKADSKYILSATQPIKRSSPAHTQAGPVVARRAPRQRRQIPLFVWLLAFAGAGALLYALTESIFNPKASPTAPKTGRRVEAPRWTLDLADANIPDHRARGRIRGRSFVCNRAILEDGVLALRQVAPRHPELTVNVYFFDQTARQLSGRTFNVATNAAAMPPKVILRWENHGTAAAQVFTNGYAMKLEFGSLVRGRMRAQVYLCLPDAAKSCLAGRFRAEVRK